MRRRGTDEGFWDSYADLATGTMVIFLLLMVALAAAMQEQRKELEDQVRVQKENVEKLTEQVQVILGTRQKLAEALKGAVADKATVDPVTAQMVILQGESTISFDEGQAEISPRSDGFIRSFVPAYICALRQTECRSQTQGTGGCDWLDPERLQGVRRILVTGSADLKGNGTSNMTLSAARANAVVARSLAVLRDPQALQSTPCAQEAEALYRYAQARLMALGAGDLEHCRARVRANQTSSCEGNDSIDPNYRRVTFELELTGADMSGLVLNILDLMKATEGVETAKQAAETEASRAEAAKPKSTAVLETLRKDIYKGCQEDASRYHACADYINLCQKDPQPDFCAGSRPHPTPTAGGGE